jgi:ubiquinone/menaquinone biosynthesis C-methylase UbiE
MLQESKNRNKQHIQDKKLTLKFGDYLKLPFSDESFDQIFFINVIYFWDDIQAAFQKIKNELKPNGAFCFYMVQPEDLKKMKFTLDDIFHKYEIDFVVKELEQAGFKNIDYQFDIGYYISCRT